MGGGFFADGPYGVPSAFSIVVWDLLLPGDLDDKVTHFVDFFSFYSDHSFPLNSEE
jgi:hypothetical protein